MRRPEVLAQTERWLDKNQEVGALLLRLFFAFVLIYGTQDNIFSHERMLEFRDFLAQNGFIYPLASSYLSAYAQFICGILILIGFTTRIASFVMVINFIIALLMVHTALPFDANIAPLAMLTTALFFTFHGAHKYSFESFLVKKQQKTRVNIDV